MANLCLPSINFNCSSTNWNKLTITVTYFTKESEPDFALFLLFFFLLWHTQQILCSLMRGLNQTCLLIWLRGRQYQMQHCHHQNDAALSQEVWWRAYWESVTYQPHVLVTLHVTLETEVHVGTQILAEGKKREKIPNATLSPSKWCCIQMGSRSIA